MGKKKRIAFGPRVKRLYETSNEILAQGMHEKVKPAAMLAGGILIGIRTGLDHPKDSQELIDEMKLPMGVTEELMRNASILAKGRTGGRPPGAKRSH